jgi:hypothetical protein
VTFRYVRRSCDSYTWLWLTLSSLGIVAFGCAMFHADPFIPRVATMAVCGILFFPLVWCIRAIVHPFEWEVVVDDDQIRWGRADRPHRQQRVAFSQLVRLIDDRSDCLVRGDLGSGRLLDIGRGVMINPRDQRALIQHLRQRLPDLKIETT